MSQIPESLESEIFKRKPYLKNYFSSPIQNQNLALLPSKSKWEAVKNYDFPGIGISSEDYIDYVSYKEKSLASSYDPIKQAERSLNSIQIKSSDLVIILGLGNPILSHLTNELLISNPVILAIDSMEEIVPLLWEPYLIPFLQAPGRHLFCGDKFIQLLWNYLDGLPIDRLSGIKFIKNTSSLQIAPDFYLEVEARIRDLFSSKMSDLLTKFEFETLWTTNILKNSIRYFSSNNCYTISKLRAELSDIPAMLVSAGPSLRRTIPYLKSIRDKVFLLSCDTSLKVLLKSGIIPDAIYTLDAQMNSLFHFLGEDISQIPVFADMVTSPYLLDTLSPKSVVYSMTAKFIQEATGEWKREVTAGGELADAYLGDIGDIQSGGSVATTAFDALRYLGCKHVNFIGQDLAYTGREIHSTGTHHNEKWLGLVSRKQSLEKINEAVVRKRDTRYVESIEANKKVLTDYVLDLYRYWFEESAKSIDDMQLVNFGWEGARIEGMSNQNPENMESYFNNYKNHNYPWKNHPIWNSESKLRPLNVDDSIKGKTHHKDTNKSNQNELRKKIWKDINDSIHLLKELEKEENVIPIIEEWFKDKSYLKRLYRKSEIYIARHRDNIDEQKKKSLLLNSIFKELKSLKRKLYPMMDENFFPG
jgi:hypothetical protein